MKVNHLGNTLSRCFAMGAMAVLFPATGWTSDADSWGGIKDNRNRSTGSFDGWLTMQQRVRPDLRRDSRPG